MFKQTEICVSFLPYVRVTPRGLALLSGEVRYGNRFQPHFFSQWKKEGQIELYASSLTKFWVMTNTIFSCVWTDSFFSLPGNREKRWDCFQGCPPTGHPHTHGDIRGIPEENSPHHCWLHPQLAPAGSDWSRGTRRGGIIITCDQHDGQLWICWIKIHCCLRHIYPNRCVSDSCDIERRSSNFILCGSSDDIVIDARKKMC